MGDGRAADGPPVPGAGRREGEGEDEDGEARGGGPPVAPFWADDVSLRLIWAVSRSMSADEIESVMFGHELGM